LPRSDILKGAGDTLVMSFMAKCDQVMLAGDRTEAMRRVRKRHEGLFDAGRFATNSGSGELAPASGQLCDADYTIVDFRSKATNCDLRHRLTGTPHLMDAPASKGLRATN
jgi:hypothetical protein